MVHPWFLKGYDMINTEELKARRSRGKIPGWKWKGSVVVSVILPLALIFLVPLGGLLYLCGRLGLHIGLVMCMLYPAVGLFIVFCFVASAARLLVGWRKFTDKRKLLGIAQVGIPIVFAILCVIGSPLLTKSLFWPDATPFTYGFRDRVRSRTDIPAIRAWLRTFDKSDYEVPGDRVPTDQWPESLRALKPTGRVFLGPDKRGNPLIRIVWGAATFHWGLTIGLEDMEIPPLELDDYYEAWLLVEPGVYVYDW